MRQVSPQRKAAELPWPTEEEGKKVLNEVGLLKVFIVWSQKTRQRVMFHGRIKGQTINTGNGGRPGKSRASITKGRRGSPLQATEDGKGNNHRTGLDNIRGVIEVTEARW